MSGFFYLKFNIINGAVIYYLSDERVINYYKPIKLLLMLEVNTINDLRSIVGSSVGDTRYVRYHTYPFDMGGGVFMWRNDALLLNDPNNYYDEDNDGTLIKVNGNNTGRWVRQYDGYINIAYFGGCRDLYATDALQAAIDFSWRNITTSSAPTRGCVVFIPSGGYVINEITLRYGVQILGSSVDQPVIYAGLPGDPGYSSTNDYLVNMTPDVIQVEVSNLNFAGRGTDKGCIHLKAQHGSGGTNDDGGIWQSSFKNIKIGDFKGNGIYSEGGVGGLLPNQFMVFELVSVGMNKNAPQSSCALKITGQNGQITFLNSAFNGYNDNNRFHNGHVISIAPSSSSQGAYPAVISFINATIQEGDYGVWMSYCENISFDNCWFENLGVAVTVDGTANWCRNINILNSRFANAAGYGSVPASSSNITNGQCVSVKNSQVKVINNFVTVSRLDSRSNNDSFVIASGLNSNTINPGVEVSGNSFAFPELNKTYGIWQVITAVTSNAIDCRYNKCLYVNASGNTIKNIKSELVESESFLIRANGGNIRFDNTGNIFLTHRSSLTLANGEVATFTKLGTDGYQLTSLVTDTTP